jgi:uncharacterized membrane protein HdeD (DUF308 family)
MTSGRDPRTLSRLWKVGLLSGVVAIVLGLLMTVSSSRATVAVSVVVGLFFFVSAVAQLLIASTAEVSTGGRVLLSVCGGANAFAGIAVLALPLASVDTVARVVGILLTVVGGVEVVTAFRLRTADSHRMLGDIFGDIQMLCHDVGLMNPVARGMWRVLKIDGRPSRYRSEPRRTHDR